MAKKHFEHKARRAWWRVHVEAWQRSGLSRRAYCRAHGLGSRTFTKWIVALEGERALRNKGQERRRPKKRRFFRDVRRRATQAFWAMHVEAMTWSGMPLQTYAKAHRLSTFCLRKWRDLIGSGEVAIDWRAHLHPSARPIVSSGDSSAAKESPADSTLTAASSDTPSGDRRSNRRSFTDEEKLAIVFEAEQPGSSVAAVCRRHLLQPADGMEVVELGDGRRVFAPIGSDPEAVRKHVVEQEQSR